MDVKDALAIVAAQNQLVRAHPVPSRDMVDDAVHAVEYQDLSRYGSIGIAIGALVGFSVGGLVSGTILIPETAPYALGLGIAASVLCVVAASIIGGIIGYPVGYSMGENRTATQQRIESRKNLASARAEMAYRDQMDKSIEIREAAHQELGAALDGTGFGYQLDNNGVKLVQRNAAYAPLAVELPH